MSAIGSVHCNELWRIRGSFLTLFAVIKLRIAKLEYLHVTSLKELRLRFDKLIWKPSYKLWWLDLIFLDK